MKQLTCEMCESTNFIKQDNVFVCQSCNTKYSAEEAKKLMIEVEVTVQTIQPNSIENYLKLCESAINEQNADKALEICNKIFKTDRNNACAWNFRGKANLLKSADKFNASPQERGKHFSEIIRCYHKALDNGYQNLGEDSSICDFAESVFEFIKTDDFDIPINVKQVFSLLKKSYASEPNDDKFVYTMLNSNYWLEIEEITAFDKYNLSDEVRIELGMAFMLICKDEDKLIYYIDTLREKCYKNEPNDDKLVLELFKKQLPLETWKRTAFDKYNLSNEVKIKLGMSIILNSDEQLNKQHYITAMKEVAPTEFDEEFNVREQGLKQTIETLKKQETYADKGIDISSYKTYCAKAQGIIGEIQIIKSDYIIDDETKRLIEKGKKLKAPPKNTTNPVEARQKIYNQNTSSKENKGCSPVLLFVLAILGVIAGVLIFAVDIFGIFS